MQKIIEEAIAYIQELFTGNADGHGADHTLRVYRNAMLIAESEPDADRCVVALAALLHDVDDYKLFTTENNANARRKETSSVFFDKRLHAVYRSSN